MVKRRKISTPSSSTISSPRMRIEVKEEPYLESEGSTSAAASEGSSMATARGRLRGALREALERSDDDSVALSGDDDDQHSDARPQVKKEREPAAPQSAQSLRNLRQQQRRRRRRELLSESVFHHTYVMKLFDRSVDLAQFKEDTPLYPVCRAWMTNQPHNTNLVPKQRTPTPEPPPEEPTATTSSASASVSGSLEGDEDLVRDTYRMPAPVPLPDDEVERRRLRVPSPIKRERQELELDYDLKPPVSREHLLQEHIEHWTAVRKTWHDTTRKNSSRFEASARILKAIYHKAQKAFE